MAKVLDPLRSSAASGSVGGTTYGRNKGGNYVRNKSKPVNPNTPAQLVRRAALANTSRAWSALDATERELWINYAALHPVINSLGQTTHLSGFQTFVGCTLSLEMISKAQVDTPPATPAPALVAAMVLTPTVGQISCAWTPASGTATTLLLYTVGPLSAGRVAKVDKATYAQISPAETSPSVITGLSPGTWTVFYKTVSETHGLCSVWGSAKCVVPAT